MDVDANNAPRERRSQTTISSSSTGSSSSARHEPTLSVTDDRFAFVLAGCDDMDDMDYFLDQLDEWEDCDDLGQLTKAKAELPVDEWGGPTPWDCVPGACQVSPLEIASLPTPSRPAARTCPQLPLQVESDAAASPARQGSQSGILNKHVKVKNRVHGKQPMPEDARLDSFLDADVEMTDQQLED